jgi:hypothetical protein
MNLTGKHIAILGAGRSGRAAAMLALREGARVSAWDAAGPEAFAGMPAGWNPPERHRRTGRGVPATSWSSARASIPTALRRRVFRQRGRGHRRGRTGRPFLSGQDRRHHRHQRQDHHHRTGGAHPRPMPGWAARPAATTARPSPSRDAADPPPPSRSNSVRSSSKPSARCIRWWPCG